MNPPGSGTAVTPVTRAGVGAAVTVTEPVGSGSAPEWASAATVTPTERLEAMSPLNANSSTARLSVRRSTDVTLNPGIPPVGVNCEADRVPA